MASEEAPIPRHRRSSIDEPFSLCHLEKIRILVIGPLQATLTNCILQRQEFSQDDGSPLESVKSVGEIDGRKITVINMPGLCEKEHSWRRIKKEFGKCVCLSSPGPHAVLVALDHESASPRDVTFLNSVVKYFGESILTYTLIFFFHKGQVIRERMVDAVTKVMGHEDLVEKCHFLSKEWRVARTSGQLLEKIDELAVEHGGRFYTNEDYKKAEDSIRKEETFVRKVRKKELEGKLEKLEKSYQGEELEKEKDRFKKRTDEEIREKAQKIILERLGFAPRVVDYVVVVGKGIAVGVLAGAVLGQEGMMVGGAVGAVVGAVIGGVVRGLWRYLTDNCCRPYGK